MSYMTHLECGLCGKEYETDKLWNLSPCCSKPMLARYDIDKVEKIFPKEILKERENSLWRYKEMLPVSSEDNILTLGEGFTPLKKAKRLGNLLNHPNLYIKDESLNPTTMITRNEGIFPAPEGGAALASFIELKKMNWIKEDDSVVLFNTRSGHKYMSLWANE